MGLFDIFGTGDQEAAAQAQIAGLNAGSAQATGYINQGTDALTSNAGSAITALGQNFGAGSSALSSNYGSGINALTSNYGAGSQALATNYAGALQPYLQNYGQAQSGVNQLGNVLGLNGAAGSASALQALQNTPGYQFQLQQGNNAINAAAAANGTLNSGNQMLALSNYNQGLASTTYNNYVSQLQPYLNASNSAASGISGAYTGLGNAQAANSANLGNSLASAYGSLGNAQATNSANLGTSLAGTYTGLGTATANQDNSLGQLAYSTQTGIGNANANADLAGLTASANGINAIGQGVKLATSIFSDVRLKEDISKVGELYDGTNVYSYRYKGSEVPQIGLMAQEVEKTNPDAVTEIGGYKAVDYGKATRLSSGLARFLQDAPVDDHKVVDLPARRTGQYASDLSRFLEAA